MTPPDRWPVAVTTAAVRTLAALCLLPALSGCGNGTVEDPAGNAAAAESPAAADSRAATPTSTADPATRSAYFGDLHVHTFYSFDAFIFGTRATPDDAYRYAKGHPIRHPAGFEMQLDRPLDFYAVTDHAMFLGNLPAWADGAGRSAGHPVAAAIRDADSAEERMAAFLSMRPYLQEGAGNELLDPAVVRSAWQDIQAAAERHNDPGQFTTFIAYEYTAAPDQQNLHRNVIFRGSRAPDMPFSRLDSMNPENLWRWMDNLRDQGIESLAIPHNANGSNGQMFALTDWAGDPLDDAYAERRLRNEPLVEITQVKGTSETHPLLSPNDEWAGFEIMPYRIASWRPSEPSGSYVREALLNGIAMEAAGGFNPFQFGVAGASDTHTGAASLDEETFFSKAGVLDATAELRGSVPMAEPDADGQVYRETYFQTWGASGLTGVWAEANTREAIYDALRRKETFATSGPRLTVRLFGGFGLEDGVHDDPWLLDRAYSNGVPMGGDLLPQSGVPGFVAIALQDPQGAPLQRLQMVKGWVEDGEPRERIYDVACSDGLQADPRTHRCPDNGATVDPATCRIGAGAGAAQLATTWHDPDFRADQEAFYYARVLENPTCRWSTWDAIRNGTEPRPGLPRTIQERAWSSPIWYHGSVVP